MAATVTRGPSPRLAVVLFCGSGWRLAGKLLRMDTNELRASAAEIRDQASGVAALPWSPQQWTERRSRIVELIGTESSALRLGDVLRCDVGLDLPVEVVLAAYRRLFALGASDVYTKLCYARYLLLHGPDWDDEAQEILDSVEGVARAAGLWDAPILGHHPVFYGGEE